MYLDKKESTLKVSLLNPFYLEDLCNRPSNAVVGSRVAAVIRAVIFHLSIPGLGAKCGLSLLVFYPLP